MRRNRIVVMFLALIFVLSAGCTATISPKGKALMVLSTYNTQTKLAVDDSVDCLARGDACEEPERANIRQRKAVISKLDPLVKAYGVTVKANGVPSVDDEQAIFDLIDDLVGLVP